MKRKAFLFLNISGDFLGLAERVAQEGYPVYSWYSQESLKDGTGKIGKELIEIVDDPFDILGAFINHKDRLIIWVDDNGQGDWIDYLKNEGWSVVGSGGFADDIEHDRGKGNDLAKKIGLELPNTVKFNNIDEAIGHVAKLAKKDPKTKTVFKGDGVDMAGSSYTYPSQSATDMMWYLNWLKNNKDIEGKMDSFEIQSHVEGLEVDIASWFNGNKFLPVMPVTFEQKKVHGLGAAQGCLGQVVYLADPRKEPYFAKYFSKLPSEIKDTVPNEWAINNIISEENHLPNFLEWTPRCFPYNEKLMVRYPDGLETQILSSKVWSEIKDETPIEMNTPDGFYPVIDMATKMYTGDLYTIYASSPMAYHTINKTRNNDKFFTVTGDHLIKTSEGFVKAEDLTREHKIISFGRRPYHKRLFELQVSLIEKRAVEAMPVYDFKVKNSAHEIRLPNGIIVHNCGWDAFVGEMSILQEYNRSIADFLIAVAEGTSLPKDFFPYYKFAASVRLFSGGLGFPETKSNGRPINTNPEFDKNFWWYSIRGRAGSKELTGNKFGVATAVGDSADEATGKLYDILKKENENIVTPDLYYAETIGEGVTEEIKKLQTWGILSKEGGDINGSK